MVKPNSLSPSTGLIANGEILVVEDTPASLVLLSNLLIGAGYSVRQAPNGELALWTAEARCPELILLDIRMPGLGESSVEIHGHLCSPYESAKRY